MRSDEITARDDVKESVMAKSKLEELHDKMDKVSSPLDLRRENYLNTLKKLRLQLCGYFLMTKARVYWKGRLTGSNGLTGRV